MGSGHTWQGRPVLDAAHASDLDQRAAVLEFGQRLPRDRAEAQAHDEYRREHHLAGAAHHLRGMLAAHASGDRDTAKNHALHYGLHLRALGHDSFAEVPPEVRRRAQAEAPDRLHSFKSHPADNFISEHLGKAEPGGWMPAFVNPAVAAAPRPPPFRAPGSPRYDVGHSVVMRGDKGDQFGRLDVGRVVGREHRGAQGHHYNVEWTKPYENLKYSGTHSEYDLAPAPPATKSEETAVETPSQKLQKFWDDKHAAEEKQRLVKRASAVVLGKLLQRLEKGGAAGGAAEPAVKGELCKKCGQMHKAGAACMEKAAPPPSAVQKSERELRADALRKFWDEKPHQPGFRYVS